MNWWIIRKNSSYEDDSVKDDQEQNDAALVSSANRGLTRNSGLVRRGLDDLLTRVGEFDTSVVAANESRSLLPAFDEENYYKAKRFFYRGRAKRDGGDFRGAIVEFDKAIEIDPRHARYYFHRGVAKQGNGDLDHAIVDYTNAIELDPQHSLVYNNRAAAKWTQGDLEGALADYDKAIDVPGRYSGAYINRGALKQRNGNLEGAIADYTRAIDQVTDPLFISFVAMAYAFRGLAYLWQASDVDAQHDFTKCLELDGSQETWIDKAVGEVRERRATLSWLIPRYASSYSD
jgi:tetratricopeptide (TPR) repeat protein